MAKRVAPTALTALLFIGTSPLWAADQKPPESAKQIDDSHLKKHCEDMKQGKDMSEHNSKMTPAEHEAMMKKCREIQEQEDKDARNK